LREAEGASGLGNTAEHPHRGHLALTFALAQCNFLPANRDWRRPRRV